MHSAMDFRWRITGTEVPFYSNFVCILSVSSSNSTFPDARVSSIYTAIVLYGFFVFSLFV